MPFRERSRAKIRSSIAAMRLSSKIPFVLYVAVCAIAVESTVTLIEPSKIIEFMGGEYAFKIILVFLLSFIGFLYRYVRYFLERTTEYAITKSTAWLKLSILRVSIRFYLFQGPHRDSRPIVTQIGTAQIMRKFILAILLCLSAIISLIFNINEIYTPFLLVSMSLIFFVDGVFTRNRIKSGAYGEADYELDELIGFLADRIIRDDDPGGPNKVFPSRREDAVQNTPSAMRAGVR